MQDMEFVTNFQAKYCGWVRWLMLSVWIVTLECWGQPLAESFPMPIIGPDVFSFGDLEPVTILYHPLAIVQPQNGLPAPEGAVFEGPDPGLNANIIGGSDCPNNYRKDSSGICRLEFAYGPNPFSAIIPQTFKGSLQFYMGLQVGNPNKNLSPRRRVPFRLRGRPRNRKNKSRSFPFNSHQNEDDDD